MTIGEALRRFRREFRLKQDDIATVLKLTRQAYSFYEMDKSFPPAQKVVELAKAYNVSADYLLGLSDEPRPKKYDEKEIEEAFALRDSLKKIMSRNTI